MKKKILSFSLLLTFICLFYPNGLWAEESKIKVVTTTSILADFVEHVAGDKAEVYYVASPNRDLHFIEPTPKDVLKTKKADVFVHHGLDGEPWRIPLVNAAGNSKLFGTSSAVIDVSSGISLLEVPAELSRLKGDIHVFGNPHYWTDPENAKIMIKNISQGLSRLYPDDAAFFRDNAEAYQTAIGEAGLRWKAALQPYEGENILVYHRSWSYFAKRFGFEIVGEIEPKPGIPPTGKHLSELTHIIREKKVKVILKESYFETKSAKKLMEDAAVKVAEPSQFPGRDRQEADYLSMMDRNIEKIKQAFSS